MDDSRPEIRALIAYPMFDGNVVLSKQSTVTLEDALEYHRLGFIVLVDPLDEQLLADWHREQIWYDRKRWLT